MKDDKTIPEVYQPLFDLMLNWYGVTLVRSEMDEIILVANRIAGNEELKHWKNKCRQLEEQVEELGYEIKEMNNRNE